VTGTVPVLSAVLLGLVHGARHALEPDHLVAVSTLVVESPGTRRGAWLGAAWGVGHTVTLLLVAIVVAAAGGALPHEVEHGMQLVVAAVLVALGIRAIRLPVRVQQGEHREAVSSRRSLAIGMIHGLAGSGALTALTIAELPSTAMRLAFLVVFGLGSIAGMAALSGALGLPLSRASRFAGLARPLNTIAGCAAIVVALATATVALRDLGAWRIW